MGGGYLVGSPPLIECHAVHSGITKGGGVPKMSRLISLRVFSLFKTSPHPLLRLSLDHLERQKQPGAAKADRYMSWEVHIESPGIHLFLKEKKTKKKQGKRRERMGF